ncbi:MAG: GNAT family N-acetyltransferase [Candidatus Diapherotrites archaeon]|nr:GNAT family N-acetyltransferase [Candidatus Diapherotrites archaeon]
MADIKIRLMKKTDLSALAKMYAKVYTIVNMGENWTTGSAKKLLEYWLKKQPDLSFVAEFDGKIVGAFTSGIKPWWDGNHLFDGEIFVDNNYQGKGIGTKLIKVLFETAVKKYNATVFEAATYTKTEFPLDWYKSMGINISTGLVLISGKIKDVIKKLKYFFSVFKQRFQI